MEKRNKKEAEAKREKSENKENRDPEGAFREKDADADGYGISCGNGDHRNSGVDGFSHCYTGGRNHVPDNCGTGVCALLGKRQRKEWRPGKKEKRNRNSMGIARERRRTMADERQK